MKSVLKLVAILLAIGAITQSFTQAMASGSKKSTQDDQIVRERGDQPGI